MVISLQARVIATMHSAHATATYVVDDPTVTEKPSEGSQTPPLWRSVLLPSALQRKMSANAAAAAIVNPSKPRRKWDFSL